MSFSVSVPIAPSSALDILAALLTYQSSTITFLEYTGPLCCRSPRDLSIQQAGDLYLSPQCVLVGNCEHTSSSVRRCHCGGMRLHPSSNRSRYQDRTNLDRIGFTAYIRPYIQRFLSVVLLAWAETSALARQGLSWMYLGPSLLDKMASLGSTDGSVGTKSSILWAFYRDQL